VDKGDCSCDVSLRDYLHNLGVVSARVSAVGWSDCSSDWRDILLIAIYVYIRL
jgi:hypothetical protein